MAPWKAQYCSGLSTHGASVCLLRHSAGSWPAGPVRLRECADSQSFESWRDRQLSGIGVAGGSDRHLILRHKDYKFHFPSWAPYVQDQWQVTEKLSLTLGLRYDYYSTPDLTKGTTSELDPSDGSWLIGGGVLPPACSSTQSAPCIPGGSLANVPDGNHIKVASNPNIGPNPVTSNFGPRIGLAYQLDPTTAIRAGYGIVYDSLIGITRLPRQCGKLAGRH